MLVMQQSLSCIAYQPNPLPPVNIRAQWLEYCNLNKLAELTLEQQIEFYEILLEKKIDGKITKDEADIIFNFLLDVVDKSLHPNESSLYRAPVQLQRIMFGKFQGSTIDAIEEKMNGYYFEAQQFITETADKKQSPYTKDEITGQVEQTLNAVNYMRMSILAYEIFHNLQAEPKLSFSIDAEDSKSEVIIALMNRYGYQHAEKTWAEQLNPEKEKLEKTI